jgi:hypothetical protein
LIEPFEGAAINANLWTEVEVLDSTKAFAPGLLTYHLHGTGESEDVGLYGKDIKTWNIDKGLQFECRLAVHVLPTSASELIIGVMNDSYGAASMNVGAADSIDKHALFVFDGSGLCKIFNDDGTDEHDAITTGITVVPDIYHIFRIDFTNPADVKFYIDGVCVASTTVFKMNTVAALLVQPVVMLTKLAADTGLGDIYLNYIKLWSTRT